MFNISKITEQHPWSLNSCYNRNIDFCIWVLQVAGLDAQAWLTWLTLVVATQDNRLHWHVENVSAEVERQLSRTVELRNFSSY